jgi:hypothetical protein
MFIKTPPILPDTPPALEEWHKDVYNSCTTPILRVTYTDWQELLTATWTTMAWNIVNIDTHSLYAGGPVGTFTPKVPGYYLIHVEGQMHVYAATMPAATQFQWAITKNGGGLNIREWRNFNAVKTGYEMIPYESTAVAFFDGKSDNFGVVMIQTSGSTWYDFTYGSPHNTGRFLTVYKLPH